MSEERRNRQKEREPQPAQGRGKVWIYIAILILFAIAYFGGRYYKSHKYDSFAKCVGGHAKMYGLYWCPHCADQKALLGSAFEYVPYVECASPGNPRELTAECKAAGVKLFPSWQFGNEPPKEGVLTLEDLSHKTGCTLP